MNKKEIQDAVDAEAASFIYIADVTNKLILNIVKQKRINPELIITSMLVLAAKSIIDHAGSPEDGVERCHEIINAYWINKANMAGRH